AIFARFRQMSIRLAAMVARSTMPRTRLFISTGPGVGFITATAIAATVTDPSHFRSSREFAAWLGLTPRQNSSGGKDRLGRVSKMGNGYLRSLILVGATAMIRLCPREGRGQQQMDQRTI